MTATETQPDHLDRAYEAVRSHLHERPYAEDPSLLYRDLGSLSQLLGALDTWTINAQLALEDATRADDSDHPTTHIAYAGDHLAALGDRLRQAAQEVDLAHTRVSHLIFGEQA